MGLPSQFKARYQKLEKIGEGSCGVVFKCRDRDGNRVVAVKEIRFKYDGDDGPGGFGAPASALREVSSLKSLAGHPNVVDMYDTFVEGSGHIFLVCEYLDCDLRRYMDDYGRLQLQRVKLYTWQLLRALAHCHGHRIAHRDVKPQNVLVRPERAIIKLCDFSLAHTLAVPPSSPQTRRVASLWYRSPEILLGGEVQGSCLDVWSAGCVCGEMLVHLPVFPGGSEIETLLLQFRSLGTPSDATWAGISSLPHWSKRFPCFPAPRPGLPDLARGDAAAGWALAGLLRCDPGARLSAEGALSHPYFLDVDRTILADSAERAKPLADAVDAAAAQGKKRSRKSEVAETFGAVDERAPAAR